MYKADRDVPSHKELIYTQIAEQGTVSKAELLDRHKLTSSTLTRVLEELVAEGLIEETGLGPSSGGRRPILYQIHAGYRYIFGLEISRFSSTLGLFDMQLNQKSLVRWRMDEAMTPQALVDYASQLMRTLLRDHRIEREQILGIGIGAVGPLDRSSGMILDPLYFAARGWTQVPICQMFEEATGFTAFLENGANTALLGERWALRHEDIEHALYVHAGVSLRSAIMSYGRIVHGTMDMEGSIGQMIIHTDGPRLSPAGNYGALEAYASIQALEHQARSHAKMGQDSLLKAYSVTPEQLNYEVLLQALSADDPYVQELFQQSAVYFGVGLANLINIFHPELVILGGALINSKPMYFQTATETAKKNTYYSPAYEPRFSKGQLKEDAVVTGAALTVRNKMRI
ncbi:ROK family transcriptional regulator [Paenibacillus sp. FSL H8-0537]|uniref:ROK family transcriptional regulator n=1 Tax=Paenibacillus sp. FSL H8-0537 TaxID=2921399 RepID=UPI003100ED32